MNPYTTTDKEIAEAALMGYLMKIIMIGQVAEDALAKGEVGLYDQLLAEATTLQGKAERIERAFGLDTDN